MVASVEQGHGHIDHWEPHRPLLHRVLDALLNRRDPLLRDCPAMDLLLELEAFAATQRPDLDDHVAILAMAARLLLVATPLLCRFTDRFTIADRGRMMADL